MTFDEFKSHLEALHKREIQAEFREEGDTTMYNIPKIVNDDTFAYSYDALCTCVMRFNADGTVDEWCDVDADPTHQFGYSPDKPHMTHDSIEGWMIWQIKAVNPATYS